MTDKEAMDAIHALLDRREWDSDTFESIVDIVHGTGRTVRDCEPEPEFGMTQAELYAAITKFGLGGAS